MKFRKLLLCMLAGIFLAGFANIYTYAAEEDQNVTVNTDTTDKTADVQNTAADTNIAAATDNAAAGDTQEQNAAETTAETASAVDTAKEDTAVTADTTAKEQATKAADTKKKAAAKTTKTTKAVTAKKTATKETAKYSKADLRLLSALIYCEAGGEAYSGKLAVGIVVMNRVRASAFPDTVKSVIYQRYQFGPVTNGALNKALSEYDAGKFTSQNETACVKAAKEALSGTRDITISGKTKKFGSYLFFSGRLRGYTYRLGNHQFK
ncbi:cell wall hydrolase [Anaerocolumna xylanovorans]|uniref:Cell Wall Hydrolase n=1 Tax=Anaerocolumna xylanovorans DSM 12503 TaxID=1121345 RepID=A0A1M7Y4R6_9FIRM|nr:cell wall hydrolase [Anaerocolumna xylanovorans]SHO47260.1 Cell Wall Hydrolase [Anaerocolumna xylanovorans DSM 12503]